MICTKKEDFIIGNYYSMSYCSSEYLFKITSKDDKNFGAVYIYDNSRYNKSSNNFSDYLACIDSNTSDATSEQIAWLNACIKADKFIPLKEVNQIDNYEMY